MFLKDNVMNDNNNKLTTNILSICKETKTHDLSNNELTIAIKPEDLLSVFKKLKENINLSFDMLIDITAVDYPKRNKRFEVVYHLLSLTNKNRLRVKIFVNENTPVSSLTEIYKCAGWYEREVWDMYGILFEGNHDLRRILTDYGFEGHPLRKDFPLTGFVELRYDEEKKKVSYSKVKLTQDYRDFDFLSPWEGNILPGDEKADN